MTKPHKEDYCYQENRISSLENEMEVKKQRLNHYKHAVEDIKDDLEEIKENHHHSELLLTKAVDEMKVEVVEIHTTIKNVTLILSMITGIVAVLIALPDLAILFL
ncbi:hypothetical protein [Methanobrevibacter woesei]|uniref:hypothetical protein n=1 Tax=Methanobrevibacter woesei TaxID=190976 RepID=UPI0024B7B973|nr:hypothetical protein [Methanobrevibacter woesei]